MSTSSCSIQHLVKVRGAPDLSQLAKVAMSALSGPTQHPVKDNGTPVSILLCKMHGQLAKIAMSALSCPTQHPVKVSSTLVLSSFTNITIPREGRLPQL